MSETANNKQPIAGVFAKGNWCLLSAEGGLKSLQGVLPEKLVRGVWPTSPNPYPMYDQYLQILPTYLWPDQNF